MRLALVLLLSAALLPVAAVASSSTAHIRFISTSPVSVRGAGFEPGERVAVTVSSKVTRRKTVTASLRGVFRATFSGVSIARCQAYAVSARGNRGSTASAKGIPECAEPVPNGPDPLFPTDPIPTKP